ESRGEDVSALTQGDELPALLSPELREREPARHLDGVLVLRLGRHGADGQGTDERRHKSDRPQALALHTGFLVAEWIAHYVSGGGPGPLHHGVRPLASAR